MTNTHTYHFKLPKEVTLKLMGADITVPTVYVLPMFAKIGKILAWSDEEEHVCSVHVEIKDATVKTLKQLISISSILHTDLFFAERWITVGTDIIRETDGYITPKGISLHYKNVHPNRQPSVMEAIRKGEQLNPYVHVFDVKAGTFLRYWTPVKPVSKKDKQNDSVGWFTRLFFPSAA